MKFKDIEVSGIVNIVFNRKSQWVFTDIGDKGKVWRLLSNPAQGEIPGFPINGPYRYHGEMMRIINAVKNDPRYRMWVHFDTLNIVRKEPKFLKMLRILFP